MSKELRFKEDCSLWTLSTDQVVKLEDIERTWPPKPLKEEKTNTLHVLPSPPKPNSTNPCVILYPKKKKTKFLVFEDGDALNSKFF